MRGNGWVEDEPAEGGAGREREQEGGGTGGRLVFLGSRWASSWRKGCRPSVYSVCLFPGVSRVRGGSVLFWSVWGRGRGTEAASMYNFCP